MNRAPRLVHLGVALASGVALLAAGAQARAAEAHAHFGYSGANGPEHWAEEDPAFATCGSGHHQSPIDIVDAKTDKSLAPIEFAYKPTALTVTDTGHGFQVNAAPGSGGITVGGDHYDLVQFHFHRPSEERVAGHRYAMVAHLVHKNAKGDLAVVAVLIRKGGENAFLKPVFDDFPPKGTAEKSVPGATVDLGSFLPAARGYYTFDGSLTTPPCTEHVRWFVLKNAVTASPEQIGQFAERYPMDARPTQPLNDRTIEQTAD